MLHIAVCDDDVFTVHFICKEIESFFLKNNTAVSFAQFYRGDALLRQMTEEPLYYDAIFLDIGMEGTNGLETARGLRQMGITSYLVFITAFKDYVFDAFDVAAQNYLLKPLDVEKLHQCLQKLLLAQESTEAQFLVLQKNKQFTKLPCASIVYCEVLNHHAFIHETQKQHPCAMNAQTLLKALPATFFQCHRNYIVHLNHVQGYSEGFALMSNGAKIPVSTRKHKDFLKALLLFLQN